jgi:predicted phage tail protein
MPDYEVTSPDGKKFVVTAPDGASQDQVLAYAQQQFAQQAQQPPQVRQPSAIDRAAAVPAGFNAGVLNTIGLPGTALVNAGNLASAGLGYMHSKVTGEAPPENIYAPVDPARVPLTGAWLNRIFNSTPAGNVSEIPRPDDKASRFLYAVGSGGTAALNPAGGARMLPNLVSGVAGAGASQVAAESGADPGTQAAAGLIGSVAPSGARYAAASGTKYLMRGGEQGRQQVAQNIQTFKDAGTTPSIGQATENARNRATESLLTRTPGAAGRMSAKGEQQAAELGQNIDRLATKLAPKSSGEQAGRAITKGISGEGGFVEQFKAKQESLYNELDKHIGKQQPVDVTNTKNALAALNASINGAENVSKFFKNAKIQGIEEALSKDVALTGGTLPYEAVKKLRTLVGREMADSGLMSDVPRSKWTAVYGALSGDLETAAKQSGADATAAFNRANNYTRVGMKRLEVLDSVIDKAGGPESVFRAATSGTKEGATTLRSVMQSLPPDAQKTVSATVLRRMGRATSGKQDDLGEKFSTETFLTSWNTMSPQAKAVLFDRYGKGFRQDMDAVAKVTSNLRQGSAVYRNPSGTGQAVAQTSAGVAFLTSLFTGNAHVAGAIAGGVGAANLGARYMTNPRVVAWLAKSTRAPKSAIPALIAEAAMSNDPDLQDLANELRNAK